MNKYRKLNKKSIHQGRLKQELRRNRKRNNLRAVVCLIAAVILSLIVISATLLFMLGLANAGATSGNSEEQGSTIQSTGLNESTQDVDVVENNNDILSSPLDPFGAGYHYHLSIDEVIEPLSESITKDIKDIVKEPAPTDPSYLHITEAEREAFAILLYLEAGAEPVECQYACGSVVINRFTMGNYESLLDVIYQKNQFSPAHLINQYEPKEEMLQIVDDLCENGPTIPEYVTYFRTDYYHTWSTVEDWKMFEGNTNDVYFSYDPKLKAKWEDENNIE